MSYQALYRKWRPQNFEDVKGQEHIVTTLKNQIRLGRIGHAYLFCGTRGTGKTTVAKIFARAVNCEHPVDGSPCGECAMCRAIQSQVSLRLMQLPTTVWIISVRFGTRWSTLRQREDSKCTSLMRCTCFPSVLLTLC